jgi:F-box-like
LEERFLDKHPNRDGGYPPFFSSLKYPSEGHIRHLNDLVDDLEPRHRATKREIAELEHAAESLKPKLKELHVRCIALEEELLEARLGLGPRFSSRIPVEILCIIFRYYSALPTQTAWTLTHVCRTWRGVALEYPLLWNTIRYSSSARTAKSAQQYIYLNDENEEYVTSAAQAQRALRRTKDAELEVEITLVCREPPNEELLEDMIPFVRGSMARWQKLVFKSDVGTEEQMDYLEGMLNKLFSGAFPSLCQLSLATTSAAGILRALDRGAPKLRCLSIHAGGRITQLLGEPWLNQIEVLSLDVTDTKELIAIPRIVTEGTSLKRLQLIDNADCWPKAPVFGSNADYVRLPNLPQLHSVRLIFRECAWPMLSGLQITKLEIYRSEGVDINPPAESQSISLAQLTELKCLSYLTTSLVGFLFDAPRLKSLTVVSSLEHFDDVKNLLFHPDRWFLRPLRVSIQTNTEHTDSLKQLLTLFKHAEISITPYSS